MEIGRGLEPDRLAERYDAKTEAEIQELTNQAVKEAIRADGSMVTLDDLDKAAEKLEDAGDYEVATDGGTVEDGTEQWDSCPARTVDSLTGMLGWNSVAVFEAGEYHDGDRLTVNKATVFVMLTDPWPEYSTVVFLDGEFHHEGNLLSGEYEGVFETHLNDYGKAEIVPLSEVSFLQRDEGGIPCYVDAEATTGTEGGNR
ncbi:hypothetical protein C486_02258 [Natrinema gari JCM 14663]|uniref:Uncharacterized protein n=2 Tax=Natrinema gari TaxID=419186 RepID=L9ZCX8_9EURY|nr:hypothetical protein C486_02258 [Natrinema gari JCM 14663]